MSDLTPGGEHAHPLDGPTEWREAACGFAREAGAILREGHGRAHAPERKGRIDLVTEYDRRSEALLLERIRHRYPRHEILAEESGVHAAGETTEDAADPAAKNEGGNAAVPGSGAGSIRWLVDPLDGTTNFAHNYPFFGVSIAVEVGGVLMAGAVYDPVRDEMFAAAAGHGATRNGHPIGVSDIPKLEDALLVTGFHYSIREKPEPTFSLFREFLLRAQGVRRDGSAALNLCYLACGRFDGFWEANLAPWDMAAGTLIVREAGGVVTRFDGGTFRVDGRQILAANGRLHVEMRQVIAETDGT